MTMISPLSAAGAGLAAPVAPAHAEGFAALISDAARDTVASIRAAETAGMDGIAGRAPIQDVVDAVMAAERSFSAALAVRDKVVTAWLDVSRMQI